MSEFQRVTNGLQPGLFSQKGAEAVAGPLVLDAFFEFIRVKSFEAVKRLFDIVVSLGLLVALLPLMLFISALIRLSSSGPAVFCQKRLTNGGRVFILYKFRTMAKNAEKKTGAIMAGKSDARVTKLGRLLRRTRLDELPQLVNVLVGDMSLIGPRPERPEIMANLVKKLPQMHRRLEVKAGLTGLAQIKSGYAACEKSYRQKLTWDIYYIEHRSLAMDFRIAFETIWVVLSGYGAR